uniref:prolipoprotein diacylglyceryl transferase n=1 Tax=Candidatus Similichlamydia epinepheli TaxID=1903953 RepID=UPI000D386599
PIICTNFLGLQISWYSCWVFLGWILSFIYFDCVSTSLSQKENDYFKITFFIFFFVGSRFGFYIENIFWGPFDEIFHISAIQEGGFSGQLGGTFAIIGVILLHSILRPGGTSLMRLLDIIAISVLPGIVCTRIGNFFNHEVLGVPTEMLLGVIFSHAEGSKKQIPLHPVQLYEAFGFLLGYALNWTSQKKHLFQGEIFGRICLVTSSTRFLLEFLKEDIGKGFPSPGQIFTLPFFLIGFSLLIWFQRKKLSVNRLLSFRQRDI